MIVKALTHDVAVRCICHGGLAGRQPPTSHLAAEHSKLEVCTGASSMQVTSMARSTIQSESTIRKYHQSTSSAHAAVLQNLIVRRPDLPERCQIYVTWAKIIMYAANSPPGDPLCPIWNTVKPLEDYHMHNTCELMLWPQQTGGRRPCSGTYGSMTHLNDRYLCNWVISMHNKLSKCLCCFRSLPRCRCKRVHLAKATEQSEQEGSGGGAVLRCNTTRIGEEMSSPDFQMGLSCVGVWVLQVVEGECAQQHDNEQHSGGPYIHQLAIIALGTIPAVDQLG